MIGKIGIWVIFFVLVVILYYCIVYRPDKKGGDRDGRI